MKDIIDVVVVGFQRPKETFFTIESLLKANDDIRIILVHDGSIEKPDLSDLNTDKIVQLHLEHGGQPKAINAGLKLVQSKYVVVMHNDIVIKDTGWIKKAVNFLKTNKEAGLVCALGWKIIYNDLIHSPYHSVSSLKSFINEENYTVLKKDFEEVFQTDTYVNVFKVGIKADVRYRLVGTSFWIDIKAKGLKCYVMRFNDGFHLKSSSRDLEVYKKMTNHDKERHWQDKITILRMKEYGIKLPLKEKEDICNI